MNQNYREFFTNRNFLQDKYGFVDRIIIIRTQAIKSLNY